MENTASFIFDDTDERYFVAIRGKAYGPLTAQEVYERIRSGEASLLHYYWVEGMGDWGRLSENKDFQILVPQKPSLDSISKIREKLTKKKRAAQAAAMPEWKKPGEENTEKKSYFLFFNNSQYGPFSKKEVERVFESGKVHGKTFVWMPGWGNWKNISELEEFSHLSATPPAAPASGDDDEKPTVKKGTKKSSADERRGAPRRPMVAKLFVHNDADVIMAVCRDISVGGMQVLTETVPGAVGSSIKLNVSPSDAKVVKGFVAQGEIVRILEDGRGFSFRFTKISADAKRAIEDYLKKG